MKEGMSFGLDLSGQCALIMGASGAIGSVVAEMLADQGVFVWLSGRDETKLKKVKENIELAGGQAGMLVVDALQTIEVNEAVQEIYAQAGRLDLLVNSTASSSFGEFLDLKDDDWEMAFQSKLMVYIRSMRAVLPIMIKAEAGVIINISGKAGKLPSPAHLPGGSMNAAVNLLTKGISDRYSSLGIRANTIAPGPIISSRFEALATQLKGSPTANSSYMSKQGSPVDVANAVVWLASKYAAHLNGIVLPLDGGAIPTV